MLSMLKSLKDNFVFDVSFLIAGALVGFILKFITEVLL